MSKVEFWSVLSWVVVSCLAVGCAQQRASGGAATGDGAAAATPMSAKTPQPDDLPCGVCSIATSGRVTGKWQKAQCISTPPGDPGSNPDVVYPVRDPRIEVIEGDQQGKQFAVEASQQEFQEGKAFEGQSASGAAPGSWSVAYIWVTDANDKACYSVLAIDR